MMRERPQPTHPLSWQARAVQAVGWGLLLSVVLIGLPVILTVLIMVVVADVVLGGSDE